MRYQWHLVIPCVSDGSNEWLSDHQMDTKPLPKPMMTTIYDMASSHAAHLLWKTPFTNTDDFKPIMHK